MRASTPAGPDLVIYPESDGQPMAQNTRQLEWIVVLYDNLTALFAGRPDVFVGSDLFWYPVQGENRIRTAPDVLAVFGRPKGHRPSYLQWLEGDIPLTVVFEVLSPGNTDEEMIEKHLFYEEHGVEEYHVYDPDTNRFTPHRRQGEMLRPVAFAGSFVSPRLGVRFDPSVNPMVVYRPDGQRFLTFLEVTAAQARAEAERDEAQKHRDEAQKQRDEAQKQRDDLQRQRDEAQKQRDDLQRQRDEAIRDKLRLGELLDKVLAQTATPDDLAELARLRRQAGASPAS